MDQLKTAIREKGIAVEELCQYSYDTNRNQTDIKNTKTGEDQTYVYDAENRLSQVSMTKDGKTAVIQQNIYNGEGQRIQKVDEMRRLTIIIRMDLWLTRQMRMESKTHRI